MLSYVALLRKQRGILHRKTISNWRHDLCIMRLKRYALIDFRVCGSRWHWTVKLGRNVNAMS
ncbi:hypothetical protein SAMN06265222_106227 [Neorhodopirellula lusitana]|uniref:Uncharacterized protein n=1 Tax=Neorhodopirellula lusitana TaxID=445327 RepID=A0ABY1Q5C4_9BACT|nr:hypothetical protein SAMN06265222_106227 [Neorhodopirellula lusitana]